MRMDTENARRLARLRRYVLAGLISAAAIGEVHPALAQLQTPPVTAAALSALLSGSTSIASGATSPVSMAQRQALAGYSPVDFGAVWDGSSHPLSASGIANAGSVNTPADVAALVNASGNTPYTWATNPLFGLTYTETTSAAAIAGSTTLVFANWPQVPDVGMTVSGTNIASGTTVTAVSVLSDPLVTVTISAAVQTGGVASGATITFAKSATQLRALQMDYLGTQSALYWACANSSFWGLAVHLPYGNAQMSTTASGTVELIAPTSLLTQPYFADGSTLMVQGHGRSCSVMTFAGNGTSGTGRFAIRSDANAAAGASALTVRDCAFVGNSPQRGGLLSHKGMYQNVRFNGFWCGIQITNDHNDIRDCDLRGNTQFNLYWGYTISFYDTHIMNTDIGGVNNSTLAGVGVAWNNTCSQNTWINVFGSGLAYGFYREDQGTNAPNTNTENWLNDNTMLHCSFEECGISTIYDYNYDVHGNTNCAVENNSLINTNLSVANGTVSMPVPSWGKAAIVVAQFSGNRYEGGAPGYGPDGGCATRPNVCFTGYVTGTTLTVTSAIAGSISLNTTLYNSSLGAVGTITAQPSGTTGGAGSYTLASSTGNLSSGTLFSGVYPTCIQASGVSNNRYLDAGWIAYISATTSYTNAAAQGDLLELNGAFATAGLLNGFSSGGTLGQLVTLHDAANTIATGNSYWPPAGVLASNTGTSGSYFYWTSGPCTVLVNSGVGNLGNGQPICVDYTNSSQASVPNALFPTTPLGYSIIGGTGAQSCMLQIGPFPILCGNAGNAVAAAAGTTQATATVLTAEHSIITSGTGGVSLPGKVAGSFTASTSTLAFKSPSVTNATSSAKTVYPPPGFGASITVISGGAATAYAADVGISLPAYSKLVFDFTSLTQIYAA